MGIIHLKNLSYLTFGIFAKHTVALWKFMFCCVLCKTRRKYSKGIGTFTRAISSTCSPCKISLKSIKKERQMKATDFFCQAVTESNANRASVQDCLLSVKPVSVKYSLCSFTMSNTECEFYWFFFAKNLPRIIYPFQSQRMSVAWFVGGLTAAW